MQTAEKPLNVVETLLTVSRNQSVSSEPILNYLKEMNPTDLMDHLNLVLEYASCGVVHRESGKTDEHLGETMLFVHGLRSAIKKATGEEK
ncbi:hypothetical protein [Pontibacter beigongshangensis]|uniref:hypothetical protein n=1 Tax=Pontibacter beigongshangensis TaxID=2574733 RepID=UPI0016507456|nr:hypothetical protein [Pontibacter beigongshangensis]